MFNAALIIVSWAALFFALMLFPKSGERQNGMVWLPICFLGVECFFALAAGVFSLLRIPVGPVSIGTASLLTAAALFLYMRKARRPAQSYYWRKGDVALAGALGLFVIGFFLYRFGGDNLIAYATNDPADRISAAMHIVTERTAIYTWPNMYFGHTSNALFIEALRPAFPGNLFFRAFEIKDVVNLWLGGLLFHAALRRFSDLKFARGAFFALTFLYVLAFPLSGALFGFGYFGISIELIIFLQIAAHMLIKQDVCPKTALLMISFGCFGMGASYTLFAPPAFAAAFMVISYYVMRMKKEPKRLIPTQLAVFAMPVVLTFIYTVVLDPGGQEEIGIQLAQDGAIYFNLFADSLPYLALVFFAVWSLLKGARQAGKRDDLYGVLGQPLIFVIYQAVFLILMLAGQASEYYYAKFNYAAWFFLLLLAGVGVVFICERQDAARAVKRLVIYAACWALLAGLTLPASARALIAWEEPSAPLAVLSSPFSIYADNFYRLSDSDLLRNNYGPGFVALCAAAYEFKQERGITSFYTNAVEVFSDDPSARFWVDALVNERIHSRDDGRAPGGDPLLFIILRNSSFYTQNREEIDSLPKVYENYMGVVIEAGYSPFLSAMAPPRAMSRTS